MSKTLSPIETFFTRYHVIIFVLLNAVVISSVVWAAYTVFISATTPQEPQATQTVFDKQTIERIEKLRASEDRSPVSLPSGRINPFVGE